ncbi:GPI-linked NAD(P)(+)--arginine ADP-ribosyltransferase 1-like isoform X5 [Anomalospiza imberbis]|uniref:GPI-linked NAD(P)(+)--arginine ADP-ribosyltransferase 1-like isoform X5 n=1 Tax=Anomalospiza imberbis TaxID=187417 RepID=UPI003590087A
MDPRPLTLALLAITVAATATAVPPGDNATPLAVALDMAPDSFDDQYRGCGRAMATALPALNRSEFRQSGHFAEGWALAAAEWRVRLSPRSPLSPAQAIALLAYTAPVPLHRTFNTAVRAAGRSRQEYRDNFHFKTLHFLLTQALGTLRDAGGPRCHRVFRGVRGVRFEARRELLELRDGRGVPGAHLPGRGHPGILLLPARGGGADPALRDLRGHRCHQRHQGWGQGTDPAPLQRDLQQLQLRVAASRAALWGWALCV